jgi:hypothetical protein
MAMTRREGSLSASSEDVTELKSRVEMETDHWDLKMSPTRRI